ncbi:putative transcriptional regulator [Azospirillum fermentarium]|uniref:hypothetical protein n=1 Tax=Azospirillum fermentarium TaxID=1233114 RepID=UPI00222665FC|nr:hypothetical protein [Azospirillum fermentarium]MCW2246649.1 putative transcriptional regulator [Azospirillum fermentarium]
MANLGFGTVRPAGPGKATESAEQRVSRLAREQALLDEARDEFRQGLTMDEDEVTAWLDALGNGDPRPLPRVYRSGQN